MRALPSGTVTFVFTDVEGSTKLLRELGAEAYARAMSEHRRLLRRAFAAHGGVEVDTQGDAFFIAFPTAPAALAAAAEALRALDTGPIRVRMALHTGTPLLAEEGYVGVDVHRAARIAACAHGGQVLVSASTASLVGSEALRDLGEHRLKDLSAPERIYQLGAHEFPPLKSLHRTNLPVPSTPFVGRDRELADVVSVLSRQNVRLLTLTGPGGTGKTRLALHAAGDVSGSYPDGVVWVGLSALRDSRLVLPTVADALETDDAPATYIGGRRMLLLLDNFEHVVDAADDVAGLLAACPQLDVLVTSRERLQIGSEHVFAVQPLAERDAVTLFAERASAVVSDFALTPDVVAICERLDNLPLAIELAAARVNVLSPRTLLERLNERLPLLTSRARDVPERQRTLRATIEWSYDLLADADKRAFCGLAVFTGGCTAEAAADVCGTDLDTLASLVDKSLIRFRDDRYWMLETLREYAASQLGPHAPRLRPRHAQWYADVAERVSPQLRGREQSRWFDFLDRELANIRDVLRWTLDERETDLGFRLATALDRWWSVRGRSAEALAWFDAALAAAPDVPRALRARALWVAGRHAALLHRVEHARALLEQAEPLLRETSPEEHVYCLCELADAALARSDAASAARLVKTAIHCAEELGDPRPLSAALAIAGNEALARGDHAHALLLLDGALSRRRLLGDNSSVVSSLHMVAEAAFLAGDKQRARLLLLEALELAHGVGHVLHIGLLSATLACIELDHDVGRARVLQREALQLFVDAGHDDFAAEIVSGIAATLCAEGRHSDAVRLWGAVDAQFARSGGALSRLDAITRSRYEPRARAALAEAADTEADVGAKLPLDSAIRLALDCVADPVTK